MDGASCDTHAASTVGQIYTGGYVFYVSDGSSFRRSDVEPVKVETTPKGPGSRLLPHLGVSRKRKYQSMDDFGDDFQKPAEEEDDEYDRSTCYLNFHICDDGDRPATSVHLGDKCASWSALSQDQRDALSLLWERVVTDRADNNRFTCAIVEGPGGCGKTRLMAHVMNHSHVNSLLLYVTKQNKRVQDFVHTDCLSGEPDPTVQKPIDLTTYAADAILGLITGRNIAGRFALTAEKLVYAISRKSPKHFTTDATVSSLSIDYEAIKVEPRLQNVTSPEDDGCVATETVVHTMGPNSDRNVIVLMDEYTMLQPPLIHTIVYNLRRLSGSPLVLLMGGDQYQLGPVGWNDGDVSAVGSSSAGSTYYTGNVRNEFIAKMNYEPLDLEMEKMKRCSGDPALGVCVKRLRRVCGANPSHAGRHTVNRVLVMYCLESGVSLYRKETEANGLCTIRKVEPVDKESLEDQHVSKGFDERVSLVDEEDLDTRRVDFTLSAVEPTRPMYDLLPLVHHYTRLFVRLAEINIRRPNSANELWPSVVNESVTAVRHLFPVVLVLTNSLCNVFAEMFLLALSTKVRECVLNAPLPSDLVDKLLPQTWAGHLRYTLRRCVRCLTINKDNAIQRQTLFLGMVYKMTSTIKADGSDNGLCNGETVVLTSIVFDNNTLDLIDCVMLRKLDRNTDRDLVMRTGLNENRMTGARKMGIMPFVPYVSENIYQMQGNTIGRNAKTFVDVANVPCKSAYVAVSRFQDSASIRGIVIGDN